MEHDKKALQGIIIRCVQNADLNLIDELDKYVEKIRMETFGWSIAEACVQMDNGQDIRTYVVPTMAERMKKDFRDFEEQRRAMYPDHDFTIKYSMWLGFKK